MVPESNSNSEKGAHVRGKSLLFDPFKAFVESSHRSEFSEKKTYFSAYLRINFWVTLYM